MSKNSIRDSTKAGLAFVCPANPTSTTNMHARSFQTARRRLQIPLFALIRYQPLVTTLNIDSSYVLAHVQWQIQHIDVFRQIILYACSLLEGPARLRRSSFEVEWRRSGQGVVVKERFRVKTGQRSGWGQERSRPMTDGRLGHRTVSQAENDLSQSKSSRY